MLTSMNSQLLTPVIIALIGTVTLNVGFVLQKSQADQLPSFTKQTIKESLRAVLKCQKWILGTLLTSFGWIMFLLAISIAPLTVIAPLNNAGVIVLALIAIVYLNEKLAVFEWVGFVVILLGVVIIPIFAPPSQEDAVPMENLTLIVLTIIVMLCFILF